MSKQPPRPPQPDQHHQHPYQQGQNQQGLHRRVAHQAPLPQQPFRRGGGMDAGGPLEVDGPIHRILLDAASPKLLLPSRAALLALLALPLVLWSGCVLLGVLHWEPELPDGLSKREFEHPLTWFDVHVFRVWGPLLPLLPFLVRLVSLGSAVWTRQPQPPSVFATSAAADETALLVGTVAVGATPRRPLRPWPTLPGHCAIAYAAVIGGRIAAYVVHVLLQRAVHLYLLSDHLLLAASMVACFQSELVMCLSDIFKAELLRGRDPRVTGPRQIAVIAGIVTSVFLLVFVYGDMYCTARWYHRPAESVVALAAGAALFNVPVMTWVWRTARRPHPSAA